MTYAELKAKQQKEMNALPVGAAFSDKQFEEMMKRWGFGVDETNKICSIGYGTFIRKSDKTAFFELLERQKKERDEALSADKTGNGYIYEMFLYELNNHEYGYTYELEDTLDALDLTYEEIQKDKRLIRGLEKARKACLAQSGY